MPWVLFDFDGVIADSGAAVLLTMQDIARRKGWPMVSNHELQTESTRALMRRWGIHFWQIPGLVRMARRMLGQHQDLIKPHPHAIPALLAAQRDGTRLAIVTSNGPDMVRHFLARHLPQVTFDVIRGNASLFGKHRDIRHVLRAYKISPGQALYVGDEVRDIVAAKRAGIRACAVTWGKENDAVLRQASPAYIARDAEDLCRVMAAACGPL